MKVIVVVLLLFFISPAFGELTKEDLKEMRQIIKEELAHVNQRFDDTNRRIDDINKRIDDMRGWIYALMALIVVAIGVPPAVYYRTEKKQTGNPSDPTYVAKQQAASMKGLHKQKKSVDKENK